MIRRTLTGLTCLLVVFGCGAPPEPKAASRQAAPSVAAGAGQAKARALEAVELAPVEPGTYGPVSVSLAEGGLALWASPSEPTRNLLVTALDGVGKKKAPPFVVGTCPSSLGLLTLKAVDRDKLALVVYSTQSDDQTISLSALLLDSNGHKKAEPLALMRTTSPLLWVDVIDTASGPIVFYATGRDNRAEIRAVGLSPAGAMRFADREVTGALRAWQVAKSADGAALAVVSAAERGHGGKVSLLLLDNQAALVGTPIALTGDGNAELDLDLSRVGNNYVLAWSERKRVDSRVMLAAVDPAGKIVTLPTAATKALGEQSLIKLVAPGSLGRAALLWEDLNLSFPRRRLSFAEIDEQGKVVSSVAYLPSSAQSNQVPEIVATKDGWSILTVDDGAAGAAAEVAETRSLYLELGPGLVPRAAEELKFAQPKGAIVPLLAWGLDCRHECRATVAFDGNPVQISTALLGDATQRDPNATLAKALATTRAVRLPELVQLETLIEVEPLADFSVTREKDRFSLSYLTYFDPATPLLKMTKPGPDGRTDPLQARLDLFSFDESAFPTEIATVSYRATSQPGVSIATSATDAGERALAWSALDQGQPQLFLSLLGADGKKRAQRMLTRRKGALDEVTVVAASDGWFAAWVDERNALPEVYVSRVTKTLERRGAEQRLSQGQGQVTAIALLPQEGYLLLTWAEARVAQQKRRVELYSRRLSLVDGQPLAPAQRLLEISGAVKFLSATRFETGAVLSWLEVMSEGNSVDAPGRVRFLRLDDKAMAAGPTTGLPEAGLSPVSVALDCPTKQCHGVVTTDAGGRGELLAFSFDPLAATVPELVSVIRSLGTVEQNVTPVLLGDHLFAIDQVDAERARILHATLRWQ